MKGVHLYAVVLGSLMVGVAILYVLYTANMEHEKIRYMLELDRRAKVIPYVDIVREESFTATSVIFRKVFENLITSQTLYIPKKVFDDDNFEGWINAVWLKNEKVAEYVANLLAGELESYMAITDVRARVVGQKEALKEAIRKGVEIKFEENVFYVIFDPSKLPKTIIQNLPGLEVCKEGLCRKITVFPDERTEITVPLRWKLAFEKAREVVEGLGSIELFAAGYCKRNCPACGVYKIGEEVELVYPERKHPCDPMQADLLGEGKGNYRAVSSAEGGCLGIGLRWERSLFECGKEEALAGLLITYYTHWFKERVKTDLNIFFPGELLTSEPTYYVLQAYVYDISEIIGGSVGFGLEKVVKMFTGPRKLKDVAFAPGSECRLVGDAKCVYPRKLGIGIAWRDEDTNFSVSGFPVTYRFVAVYRDVDGAWLAPLKAQRDSLEEEIRRVEESLMEERKKFEMCKEFLEGKCREKDKIIAEACGTTDREEISRMRARLYELEEKKELSEEEMAELKKLNRCIDTYDNISNVCDHVAEACKGEISIKIRDCEAKALRGCWEMLSMIEQGRFKEPPPPEVEGECGGNWLEKLGCKVVEGLKGAAEDVKKFISKAAACVGVSGDPCKIVGCFDTPPLSIKAVTDFGGCTLHAFGPTATPSLFNYLIHSVVDPHSYAKPFFDVFLTGSSPRELLDGLYPNTDEGVVCRALQITDLGDVCRAVRVYNKYKKGELRLTEEENKVVKEMLSEDGPCFKPRCQGIPATPALGCDLSGVLYSTIHINPATQAYRIGCYAG